MAEQKYEEFQSNTTSQKAEIGKLMERLPKQGSSNQLLLAISKIEVPSFQPRRFFDPQKLEQLAKSIQNYGILENLIVRPLETGNYELVAGERRLRAAIAIGLAEVPVTVCELTDGQALSLALVENLQRTDLNPIEETEGILRLLALRLDITTDEVVALLYRLQNEVRGKTTHNIIGSSQFHQVESVFSEIGRFTWESFIINRLPLLKMPSEILDLVREGKLAYTKAQAIARVKDPDFQKVLLDETLSKNLSLGQLRKKIQTSLETIAPVPTVPQNLLDQTYKRIQASKAWSDPQKRERVKELLRELSALLEG
jgi:ParB family transcriptional regulator, chromosome partitioning protein